VRFFLLLAAVLIAAPASAEIPQIKFYAGAQGAWYDNASLPSDFELGGTAKASLQKHLSLVGSSFYGINESYLRGSAGVRYTVAQDATDDPNRSDFSIGIGAQYNVSSEPEIRPEEWTGDVSVGWRPWPADMPALILVGQSSYGFTSEKVNAILGIRVELGGVQ